MTLAPLTNTHIHTNFSFSVFERPAQAVDQAVAENISILGINDHYTVKGHAAFRAACEARRVCPMYSMEAVALDADAQKHGRRLNDPGNPGRCYLTAKSVTKSLAKGSKSAAALDRMRNALTARNVALIANLNRHLDAVNADITLDMATVEALTPKGNTTERHVIQVLAEAVSALGADRAKAVFKALCGEEPAEMANAAKLQDWLRGKLIKAGCPDYAPELPEAFLPIEDMVRLYLDMGAVPTYPVLGNPETEGEADLSSLIKWCEQKRIFALEVIPNRNTRQRLDTIVAAARMARIPICTGTEHNTKMPGPLLDKFSAKEPFRTTFFEGALVMLGHAEEVRHGRPGYVDVSGKLLFADRAKGLDYFMRVGEEVYKKAISPA